MSCSSAPVAHGEYYASMFLPFLETFLQIPALSLNSNSKNDRHNCKDAQTSTQVALAVNWASLGV